MKKVTVLLLQFVLLLFISMNALAGSEVEVAVFSSADKPNITLDPNFRLAPESIEMLLYDNGPLVNSPGTGAGGADESVLQSTSLGMNTIGFGHQFSLSYRMADDFTVTDYQWTLDSLVFYSYQTGSTTTSTITGVYYQIWNGSPDNPASTVVFGDTVTNRMIHTSWSGIYRVTETTHGATNRPIFKSTVSSGVTLPAGTYWIEWMTAGTLASGPWAPPITINGQTTTGNALQYTTAWAPANDTGTLTQQGMPFTIHGSIVPQVGQFLVWIHPGLAAGMPSIASGDSLYNALVNNGQAVTLSNNLFVAGPDLSIYEGIFVVLGIFPDNGVILSTDPEGPALEAYLNNGGRIFLEGGDCFNYDPLVGGYNIQPWFGLNAGNDGSGDVFGVIGLNDLSAFSFTYNGSNNWMDQLAPATSFPIWQNSQNTNICGVFGTFGAGRAVGVVPSFGGFVNSLEGLNSQLRTATVSEQSQVPFAYKAARVRPNSVPLIRKYAYHPELKKDREANYKFSAGGVGIEANNKTDLMAAYLGLFRNVSNPQILVSPTALADTLVIGAAEDKVLSISNIGGALASPLTFDIVENPPVDWLSEAPVSGSVPTTTTTDITVTFSAVGLMAGMYNTTLEITSNDPQNPMVPVTVQLSVLEAPVIGVVPDTFDVTLTPDSSTTGIIAISNTGLGILDFTITAEGAGEAAAAINVIGSSDVRNAPILAVGKSVPLAELAKIPRSFNTSSQKQIDKNAVSYQNINSGLQPVYNIDAEEIFGSMQTLYGPAGARGRGNIFACTQSTTLTEHRLYLNVTAATTMYFVVYEGLVQEGDYTLISAADVSPSGTGEGWYSSGPVSVPLVAGRFYCIFAQWEAPANYWAELNVPVYPIPASFGSLIAGLGYDIAPAYAVPPALTQNTTGAFGNAVAYYQTIVTGAGSTWLSFDITSGQIQSGGSQNVTVTFDPAGLVGGDYYARIMVNSNDPNNPQVGIGVHMLVVGQAVVGHTPEPLVMDDTFTGATDEKSLWVKNTGSDTLRVSNIISTNAVFTLSQTQFNVAPPLDSVEVIVTFSPILAGLHEGYLFVESNDPLTPVDTVVVTGLALEAPLAVVNPTFQNPVYVAMGDSTDIFINVGNAGGSPLIWTAQLSSIPATERKVIQPVYGPVEVSEAADRSPNTGISHSRISIEATWDLQLSFNLEIASGALGNAGAEYDGTYFYTTRWASNLLHKYDMTGALVEEFSIPGVSGLRDLAFDGTYMYGGAAANTIFMMDFVTKTLIGSIPTPVAVRNITYDPTYDGFWIGNWATDLVLIDRSGNTLASIPAATHGLVSMYGSAYDGWTDGGPYLWVFDQGPLGDSAILQQFNLNTLTITGVTHNVGLDFPTTSPIAGGLFTGEDIVGGKASIGGVCQGTPDMFFVYELAETAPDWIRLLANGGVISPSDQFDIPVKLYGNATPGDTAYVIITTNDPALPVTSVQVIRTMVVGINEQKTVPITFAISQNYPNPFNPSTSIKYQLPQTSDVRLLIYNVLGQQVRTLVNGTIEAGYHSVVWDGRNDAGEGVASGVYIYRFEAGDFTRTMKLMLLK